MDQREAAQTVTVRLFVDPALLTEGDVEVSGADHHYLFRVRRLTGGAEVALFDGGGRQALAEVVAIDGETARLRVGQVSEPNAAPGCSIAIGLALIKGDRMEWCIQKLVELGISRIVPIQTARSVIRLSGGRADNRVQRWTTVARDAARQSGRATVPAIAAVCSLADALAELAPANLKALLWEQERTLSLWELVTGQRCDSAALLVGPEGGWEPGEVDDALAAGFTPVGMGPRVLRSETAAIAAVTAVGLALGDIG